MEDPARTSQGLFGFSPLSRMTPYFCRMTAYIVAGAATPLVPLVVIWVEGACWEDLFPRSHTLTLPHVA